jgi:hypothetical protein
MMTLIVNEQAPVPPPAYLRAQARLSPALQIDPLTLMKTLHLLALCRLAVRLAHRRCPPPLPAGPGGTPQTYSAASLLLIALLRTRLPALPTWDMCDWLYAWPALAPACGLLLGRDGRPRIPSASQQWKRAQVAAAPLPEALFVLSVRTAIRLQLIGARDLIIDSAPILAGRRADPDTALGHAPAHHPRPLCRGSGLPLHFLVCPGTMHDAPFARPLLELAVRLYRIHSALGAVAVVPWNRHSATEPLLPATKLDQRGIGPAAAPSNAALAASSSFFTYNVPPSQGGRPSFRRSP